MLRCETEVLAVTPSRSRPDMGSVKLRTVTLNQDDVAVMTQEAIVLFRRRGV